VRIERTHPRTIFWHFQAAVDSCAPAKLFWMRPVLLLSRSGLNAPYVLPESSDISSLQQQLVVGHEEYRRVTYRDLHFRRAFAEVFANAHCSSSVRAFRRPTFRNCSAKCWSTTARALDRTVRSSRKVKLIPISCSRGFRSSPWSTRSVSTAP
jgi:hypothetical protein